VEEVDEDWRTLCLSTRMGGCRGIRDDLDGMAAMAGFVHAQGVLRQIGQLDGFDHAAWWA